MMDPNFSGRHFIQRLQHIYTNSTTTHNYQLFWHSLRKSRLTESPPQEYPARNASCTHPLVQFPPTNRGSFPVFSFLSGAPAAQNEIRSTRPSDTPTTAQNKRCMIPVKQKRGQHTNLWRMIDSRPIIPKSTITTGHSDVKDWFNDKQTQSAVPIITSWSKIRHIKF